jgi:hypothetical protein
MQACAIAHLVSDRLDLIWVEHFLLVGFHHIGWQHNIDDLASLRLSLLHALPSCAASEDHKWIATVVRYESA